jgi:DHA1 family bicyclomycin/chloramphenicol resistance-like MFS transporter
VVTVLDLGIWPLIALLVLNMLATGVLLPAVPVIALEANAHRAGSAAALLGAMQFGVGAALAPVTGLFPEGSPVAMAAVMFGATAVAVGLMFAIRPAMKRISREIGAGILRRPDCRPDSAGRG